MGNRKQNETMRRNLAFSILIVTILLELLWMFCPIHFETNDDTGILAFAAGYRTGSPIAGTIFCYYLWGKVLSVLYTITGSVPWYVCIYVFLVFVSLVFMSFHLMTIVARKGKSRFLGAVSFAVLFLTLFCYHSSAFQFTTISAICGAACITGVLCSNFTESKKWQAANYILTFILYLFAYNIRPKIGYMILACCFMVIFINTFVMHRLNIKKAVIWSMTFVCIMVGSYCINAVYESVNGWTGYREYHVERARYKDYPSISYEENPELYEGQGWSEKLYDLVVDWYFIDENVTKEALKVFNEAQEVKERANFDLGQKMQEMLSLIFWDKMLLISQVIWCLALLMLSYHYYLKRKWMNIIEIWTYFFAFCFVILFFAYQGRLPLRVYDSVLYIFMIPSIFSGALSLEFNRKKQSGEEGMYLATILGLCCIILIQMPNGMYNRAYLAADSETDRVARYTKTEVEHYVIERPENIYIYDISLSMSGDPFTVYPNEKPSNLIFWGGSGMYSPSYYQQLEKNGLNSLYPDDFFNKNIFFIGKSEIPQELFDYMQELYPDSTCSIVDGTENFVVYKFIR